MPARPHWKGYLKLSLVSCPIALFPAISAAERVSFRQVNKQTGNRLRHQLVDSVTGELVDSSDKARGYEVGQNQFLTVDDAELEAAQVRARQKPFGMALETSPRRQSEDTSERRSEAPRSPIPKVRTATPETVAIQPEPKPAPMRVENNRTIEIERCVPAAQIDARYHDTPYYIAPRDEVGIEAFAVIRDAMEAKGVVGLGHVILARRERPIVVAPFGKGLSGITLRYAHEVRNVDEYFADIPDIVLPDEMLQVAEHILEMKTADFDPALLEDCYRTVLVSMLREKQAVLPKATIPASPSPRNVINLMEALKRSLAADQSAARPPAKSMPRRAAARQKDSDAKHPSGQARKRR